LKTILVIAKQSGLAAAVNAVVDPEVYRVTAHEEIFEAEALLSQSLVDACLLDAELTDIQPIRIIKQIRRLAPACPILIYTANKQWEWEEDAYLLGVNHILGKPVRARVLNALLERCQSAEPAPSPAIYAPLPQRETSKQGLPPERALEVLRDFSAILTHSLCSESLLKQILLLLREILGVNRAAIFLRQPIPASGGSFKADELLLRPACAIGIASELLDHIALSPDRGIGRHLYRSGRILKNGSDEARTDLVAQKEFAVLGAQVAIPILDRESLVGVAVFDGRLTGEFFANEELSLIFHLLEGVGLAIKNSWLHDQIASSHEMLTDVLNELESGCIVVDRQFKVIHANPAARKFFKQGVEAGAPLVFKDLPQEIISKLFECLENSQPAEPFRWTASPPEELTLLVRVRPFRTKSSPTPNAALLVVDDVTAQERVHLLEIESANLRLTQNIATHLAHEIGNSLVPVMTFQELSRSADLPAPIQESARSGLRRISRLTKQMQFLADTGLRGQRAQPIADVVSAAIHESETPAQSRIDLARCDNSAPQLVLCEFDKLKHAFAEILINALQASPPESKVHVSCDVSTSSAGEPQVCVCIKDAGRGFSSEAAEKGTQPFYSTRTVGMGLGLTVARRVIEMHGGRLDIRPSDAGSTGMVRVYLPVADRPTIA